MSRSPSRLLSGTEARSQHSAGRGKGQHRRAVTRINVPLQQVLRVSLGQEETLGGEGDDSTLGGARRSQYKQRRRIRTSRVCRAVEAEVSGSEGLPHRYHLDESALAFCKQKYVKLVLTSYELISERCRDESQIPVGVVPAVFCREFRLPLGILALYNHHFFNHAEGGGNYGTVIKWVDFVKMMCIFILKSAPKADKVAILLRILRIRRVAELDKTFLIERI